MEELRIDRRKQTPEEREQGVKDAQLCFNLNHAFMTKPGLLSCRSGFV